jgi:hypothetical protein
MPTTKLIVEDKPLPDDDVDDDDDEIIVDETQPDDDDEGAGSASVVNDDENEHDDQDDNDDDDDVDDNDNDVDNDADDNDNNIAHQKTKSISSHCRTTNHHLRCRQCSYEADDLSDLLLHQKAHASMKSKLHSDRKHNSDIENDDQDETHTTDESNQVRHKMNTINKIYPCQLSVVSFVSVSI